MCPELHRRHPALLRPRPSLAAPPSALPCCTVLSLPLLLHPKWRPSPRTAPTWRSKKWVNPLAQRLLFSPFDVVRCSYHTYCVLIHVSCLAQRLIGTVNVFRIHISLLLSWKYSYISIYMSVYDYMGIYTLVDQKATGQPGWRLVVLVVILITTIHLVDLCGQPDD
jgi:hypothetical protein